MQILTEIYQAIINYMHFWCVIVFGALAVVYRIIYEIVKWK